MTEIVRVIAEALADHPGAVRVTEIRKLSGGCHNEVGLTTSRVDGAVFIRTALGMRIKGCNLHALRQTLAMLDTVSGEVVNRALMHEGNEVRGFYAQFPHPVLVGIEAMGSMLWFLDLLEELGIAC